MDTAEFGEKNRAYITEYIKFGDAKAGGIVATVGIVGGALGACVRMTFPAISGSLWILGIPAILAAASAALCGLACLWRALDALAPKTPSANRSLASFPDIASASDQEYAANVATLDTASIAAEYASVNRTLASVATAKFKSINSSLFWLRGLLCSTYLVVIVYAALEILTKRQ
jgi:hypothetical protein